MASGIERDVGGLSNNAGAAISTSTSATSQPNNSRSTRKHKKLPNGVSMESVPSRGRSIFASEGNVITEEFPLICYQLPKNREYFPNVCDYCLAAVDMDPAQALSYDMKDEMDWIKSLKFPFVEEISALIRKRFPMRCKTLCPHCDTIYCSEKCRKTAWDTYHELMCYDRKDVTHPMASLEESVRVYENANPILLAKILASIIQEDKRKKSNSKGSIKGKFTALSRCGRPNIDNTEMMEIYRGQGELLGKALNPESLPEYSHLFTADSILFWTTILNVNQQMIAPISPFDVYWELLHDPAALSEALQRPITNFNEIINQAYETLKPLLDLFESREINKITSVVGAGVYPIHHYFNHSCSPNARVNFLHDNATISVVTTQPIPPGEEICISYLGYSDQQKTNEERRAILLDAHGFLCSCSRCIAA